MNLEFTLSKLALRDLNSIWNYTAEKWTPRQADNYYKKIFDEINLICSHPESGKSIKDVKKNHRIRIAQTHLIIYKLEENQILIDRILHQKMDIDSRLGE